MLIAILDQAAIEAPVAQKGPIYTCQNCQNIVILKKGRIKVHHFAHKPPVNCSWGKGETTAHMEAKLLFRDEFVSRGLKAELEHSVPSLPTDRRADVVVWTPKGDRCAIELQHTGIGYDQIEQRTKSYAKAGVPVIWVPFFNPKNWANAEKLNPVEDGEYRITRFSARPLERWVHGFYFGKPWLYDPETKTLWKYKLDKHDIYKEETSWFDSDANEYSAGGYWKTSKRWKELTLWGPYSLNQVRVKITERIATSMGNHNYPGGKTANFIVISDT